MYCVTVKVAKSTSFLFAETLLFVGSLEKVKAEKMKAKNEKARASGASSKKGPFYAREKLETAVSRIICLAIR